MYISIDIGGTKIATAFIDGATGQVVQLAGTDQVAVRSIATQADLGGQVVLQRVVALANEQVAMAREQSIAIEGIGIGSAGVVDPETGAILAATDIMPGWAGQNLGQAVELATGLPTAVTNDVMAHGIGEANFGAGIGYSRVLVCAVGTGIGGAIIQDGMPVQGAHHVAGHIGHVCHRFAYGMPCSCGSKSGHIEAIASGSGIHAWYEKRRVQETTESHDLASHTTSESALHESELTFAPASNGAQVAQYASLGNTLAQRVLTESGFALGESLAGICHVADPDIVVLSGSVTHAGDVWWQAVQEGFAASAMPSIDGTKLAQGTLDSTAPLLGAAHVIEQRLRHENK